MTASKHTLDVVRGYLNRPITLNKLNPERFKVTIHRNLITVTARKNDLILAGFLDSECFPGEEGNKKYTQRVIYTSDGCKVVKDKNKIDDSLTYAYVSKNGQKFELQIRFGNRFLLNPNVVFTDVMIDSEKKDDRTHLDSFYKEERFQEWTDDGLPEELKPIVHCEKPNGIMDKYNMLAGSFLECLDSTLEYYVVAAASLQANREIALKKKVVSIKDIKDYKESYFKCRPYYYVEYPDNINPPT